MQDERTQLKYKTIEDSGKDSYPHIMIEKNEKEDKIYGCLGPIRFHSWRQDDKYGGSKYNCWIAWPVENESCISPETFFKLANKLKEALQGRLK